MINFGNKIVRSYVWTTWKILRSSKGLIHQYDDDGIVYTIYGYDGPEVILCTIWKGTVPDGIIAGGYSQSQNDTDRTDFETIYRPCANTSIDKLDLGTVQSLRRFGNMSVTSSLEFTVAGKPYSEQASQAQRSVISTSAQDAQPSGTGARRVRIIYLDSNYVKRQEDVDLLGINGVNTVATDIRFIEDMYVTQGTNAAGTVTIRSGLLGTGSDVAYIGPGTTQTFLCHHYVPSGSHCWVVGWGATTDRDVSMRLKGQIRSGSFLVDNVLDLDKLYGITGGSSGLFGRLSFDRNLHAVRLDPQTYVRVTVQASGAYSTTTRCYMNLWEEPTGSAV